MSTASKYVYTGDVALQLTTPEGEVKVLPAQKAVTKTKDRPARKAVVATTLQDWQIIPPGGGDKIWYLAGQPDWKKDGE